ncbi:FAD-dependent monooxygenase [Mesorhizobium sp.]|uniref:FAD-dependent monooxygenase n=1 Tax=Mesorhizobium sp. TaxID=1871066 RepID=UPI0025C31C18|nr:FAD-dependent monooxygenase [Mesorhizobium sp.]
MDTNVVIVGAGPAGLAVGACLKRAGVDFIILEKASELAPAWRRHYRRLHLHTVKSFSSLPFLPFPKSNPRYVPREKWSPISMPMPRVSAWSRASASR